MGIGERTRGAFGTTVCGLTLSLGLFAATSGLAQEQAPDIEPQAPDGAVEAAEFETSDPSDAESPADLQSALLTVDVDRLFSQSMFGERILEEYAAAAESLASENRRISDALRAEEVALAGQRAAMDPDVFRAEAAAFDEKAQAIRRAQDAKEQELDSLIADGREQFLQIVPPIFEAVMRERGAAALLDRRSVLMLRGSVDVTDVLIERINTQIGAGDGLPNETGVGVEE